MTSPAHCVFCGEIIPKNLAKEEFWAYMGDTDSDEYIHNSCVGDIQEFLESIEGWKTKRLEKNSK